jgi:hypothetical protein
MATCLNHGFGMLPARQQISMLDDMRKLYDEVTGKGYYRPSNRGRYTQYLSTDVEGGERTWAGLDASTPSSSADANKDDPQ